MSKKEQSQLGILLALSALATIIGSYAVAMGKNIPILSDIRKGWDRLF